MNFSKEIKETWFARLDISGFQTIYMSGLLHLFVEAWDVSFIYCAPAINGS